MKRWVKALVVALILVLATPSPPGWGFMLTGGFKPAVSPQTVVAESGTRPYRVQKGDTVWDIARREGLEPDVVLAINSLQPDSVLAEGQILNLPYQRSRMHKVRAGETLWEIAGSYEVDVEELRRINHINSPEGLQIGTMLTIPGSSGSSRLWRADTQSASRFKVAGFGWPVMGVITQGFGWNRKRFHHGLDIAAPRNTPIRATAAGKVIFAGYKSAIYGRTVMIRHNDGKCTLYGHAQKILVHVGQQVRRGQVIATVGSTGNSTGPHVHFEVRYNGETRNPLRYLR